LMFQAITGSFSDPITIPSHARMTVD